MHFISYRPTIHHFHRSTLYPSPLAWSKLSKTQVLTIYCLRSCYQPFLFLFSLQNSIRPYQTWINDTCLYCYPSSTLLKFEISKQIVSHQINTAISWVINYYHRIITTKLVRLKERTTTTTKLFTDKNKPNLYVILNYN